MNNSKPRTPREQVLEYYPNAITVKYTTKNGRNYYGIKHKDNILGKSKSKKGAWKSASRNINN